VLWDVHEKGARLQKLDYSDEGGRVGQTHKHAGHEDGCSSFRAKRSGQAWHGRDKRETCNKVQHLMVWPYPALGLPDNYSPPTQTLSSSAGRTGLFIALQRRPEAAIPKALISLCLDLKSRVLAGQAT